MGKIGAPLGFAALGEELQGDAVVAPALSGRRRAVAEDMSMMAGAADAMVFGARQDQEVIRFGAEDAGDRGKKARPASAAVVFHLGGKQRQIAAGADKHAGAFFVIQGARPGTFGSFLAQHMELRRTEALAPLFLRQLEWLGRRGRLDAVGEERLPIPLQLLDLFHRRGIRAKAASAE